MNVTARIDVTIHVVVIAVVILLVVSVRVYY